MRMFLVALVAIGLSTPSAAECQDASAFAGWVALVTTPVGGFAPDATATGPVPPFGVRARYGHWQFASDDDNTTDLAVGLSVGIGDTRITADAGRRSVKDRDDRNSLMLGLELETPLLDRSLSSAAGSMAEGGYRFGVFLKPAIGFMNETGNRDFAALSAAVSVPVSLSIPLGDEVRLVPFAAPAFGGGRLSSGGESETGTRLMVGGGLGVVDLTPGLRISAGFNKIFIEGGATVFGMTAAFGR